MRFLVDAQLPPGLAIWLREAGHDADHLLDLGMLAAPDREVWSFALVHGCVIVTKDHDFAE